MEKRPLIFVGGGGHCKSVIDVAESAGHEIIGILDTSDKIGSRVLSYKVIGTDDDILQYIDSVDFVVTVGFVKDISLRINIHRKIQEVGGKLATLIASTAHVSKYAIIEEGTVIMHHSLVNAGAKIGKGCIVNTSANIEHDVVVGDYCHISTGVMINGNCRIGEKTFIGSQSVAVNNTSIPSNSIFAAASVIRKNLYLEGLYAGNPAILIGK